LSERYDRRFRAAQEYRDAVWAVLLRARIEEWMGPVEDVLDLGCGWGEFTRNVSATRKYAMDLNPDSARYVGDDAQFLHQDCAAPWALDDDSLDVVFSSNFIEHLPDKAAIEATVAQARRCLRPGGKIIFMGPDIRFVGGAYWDFWDHHIPITEKSLRELLELNGFEVTRSIPRFLPYTMSDGRQPPLFLVRLYLMLPFLWPFLGKQFLVMASSP
jgi:SAM-dependent methyltransferase